MRLNGTEFFTVTNGTSPPRRKRLADMDAFEILCVANHCQRNGHPELAAALLKWQHAMNKPLCEPPNAA